MVGAVKEQLAFWNLAGTLFRDDERDADYTSADDDKRHPCVQALI